VIERKICVGCSACDQVGNHPAGFWSAGQTNVMMAAEMPTMSAPITAIGWFPAFCDVTPNLAFSLTVLLYSFQQTDKMSIIYL